MNSNEIQRMLRESPPEPMVRPGLETRIRAALQAAPPPTSTPRLRTMGIAAAVVLALGVGPALWFAARPAPATDISATRPPARPHPANPPPHPGDLADRSEINPFRTESRAISRDAGRAGRFLLDCLPSMMER